MKALTDVLMGYHDTGLSDRQRATHTYVIGQSGTGKSRALESWILQDVRAGHGVGVIDPHGDLYHNLVARIARLPGQAARVVLFDPLDPDWLVGFNPLQPVEGVASERLATYLTDVIIKVWKLKPEEAPRMLWLLTNSLLALIELRLTLLDLPRWLLDADYRDELLPRLRHEAVRRYFLDEYPHSPSGMHQWATPILNKLGQLLFDPDLRLIFSSPSTLDFRRMMDEQLVLLVNAPKGILGEGLSALLAAFVVAHIQKAALARADGQERKPFYLYLDEFQNYTTDNIQDILSESRKYALSLTLAHQYLKQLPESLRAAVLNTAGTIASFRLGYGDGQVLAREIFPRPDFLSETTPRLRWSSRFLPMQLERQRKDDQGWEALGRELVGLENRQFWARSRGANQPIKQSSFWMPDVPHTHHLERAIAHLRTQSGRSYAHRKNELNRDFNSDQTARETDLPLWTA
jgi:hypothetical protein